MTRVEAPERLVEIVGTIAVVLTLSFFSIPPVIEVHWTALMVEGSGLAMPKCCGVFVLLGTYAVLEATISTYSLREEILGLTL